MKETETVAKAGTETLNTVNDMLRGLMTEAGKLKDFAVEQLPDVIQQFLQWKFYEHLLFMIIPLVFLCLFSFLFYKSMKYGLTKEDGKWGLRTRFYNDDAKAFWSAIPFGLLTLIFLIITAVNFNIKWLQIMVAPKVYLLEYAASLVK